MAERDDCFLKHFRPKPVSLVMKDKISDGVFGEVFSGVYNEKKVAAKKISALFREYSDHMHSKKPLDPTIDIFKKELRACRSVSYPYICEVLGVFYDAVIREPLLVVEAVKEDLKTFLSRNKGKLSVPVQLVLSLQLTTAIRFLHLSNHGDLFHYLSDKSAFLGDKDVVKLLDCKQSFIEVKEPSLKNPDLVPFLPPEVLSTEPQYTQGGDVYSLGVLLLEIAVQKTPSSTTTPTNAESSTEPNRREQDLVLVPESHPLKKIILLCLEDKPSRRPDIIKVHSEMSLRVEGQNSVFRGDLVLQGNQKLRSFSFPHLPTPTAFASGVFLNGKVYVSGGQTADAETARVVHVYSLSEKAWSTLPLPSPQIYSQVVAVSNQLTLIGGCDASSWKVTNVISQWDSKKKQWTFDLKPMKIKRVRPAIVMHKGFLIVAGGLGVDLLHPLDSVEFADLVKFEWTIVKKLQLPKPLSCISLIAGVDTLYVVGGLDGEKVASARMWCVTTKDLLQALESANKKSKLKSLSSSHGESLWAEKNSTLLTNASFVSGGVVPLCVGGTDDQKSPSPSISAYSSSADRWVPVGLLHVPRCHSCIVTLSSTSLLVTGGYRHPQHVEESLVSDSEFIYL